MKWRVGRLSQSRRRGSSFQAVVGSFTAYNYVRNHAVGKVPQDVQGVYLFRQCCVVPRTGTAWLVKSLWFLHDGSRGVPQRGGLLLAAIKWRK